MHDGEIDIIAREATRYFSEAPQLRRGVPLTPTVGLDKALR